MNTEKKEYCRFRTNKKQVKNSVLPLFLMLLVSILAINKIHAQGPNAIEAASFEPVDATDMVNLLTGDLTYVLPLLNVPSPEGGYPVVLSYHAGVGIDQEASWVGLGWNLNPGAINRGVNGYPDDLKNGVLLEDVFDVGGSEITTTITQSYTTIDGAWTIAQSNSYNSNKGFGGSVGMGHGVKGFGGSLTIGVSPGGQSYWGVNAGITYSGKTSSGENYGISAGVSLGTNGAAVNAGFKNNNGFSTGLSINSEGVLTANVNFNEYSAVHETTFSTGMSISSKGSATITGVGFGQHLSFADSSSNSDGKYNVITEEFNFDFNVPTPVGIFGIGYNQQKVSWNLHHRKRSTVSGIFYFGEAIKYECLKKYVFSAPLVSSTTYYLTTYVDSPSDCACELPSNLGACVEATLVSPDPVNGGEHFMDVYEIGITDGIKSLNANNAMMPAVDSYSVMAQGLSGSMTPRLLKSVELLGLSRNHADSDLFSAKYNVSDYSYYQYDVNFDFKNEYSSFLNVRPKSFTNNSSAVSIRDYGVNGSNNLEYEKKESRAITYFTYSNIIHGSAANDGLLLPINYEFQEPKITISGGYKSSDAIGGFMIKSADGKTYHYSLPVFNNFISRRTIGTIENKPERESYIETTQGGYVTHWLLTAITGPDYLKLSYGRDYPDVGDYGYWVRFDYGKWTENNVWKAPYATAYDISEEDPNIKTKTYGRKELYYLDRIKTRTHTAIFVKNKREDDKGNEWERHEFGNGESGPTTAGFDVVRWTIPSQKKLRLEKIILVKNQDDQIDKSSGNLLAISGNIFTYIANDFTISNELDYNLHENIIDVHDNISETLNKAIKVIDFAPHYSYDLVKGTPNSSLGRLTLNGITFKGKENKQLMPSYKFQYFNTRDFDYDKKDLWGYHKDNPKEWSLNRISTPTGANIDIQYESDDYEIAAAETVRVFNRHLKFTFFSNQLPVNNNVPTTIQIKVEIDNQDPGVDDFQLSDYFDLNKSVSFDMWASIFHCTPIETGCYPLKSSLDMPLQQANIISLNSGDNSMIIEVIASRSSNNVSLFSGASPISFFTGAGNFTHNQKKARPYIVDSNSANYHIENYSLIHSIVSNKEPGGKIGGGLRVKELSVIDAGIANRTRYSYNQPGSNEDFGNSSYVSSGVISYQPFSQTSTQTIAYGSELPAPIPMYEYVTVKNGFNNSTGDYLDKAVYKFKVLERKDETQIKFGDLFEISEEDVFNTVNTVQNKNVNAKKILIKSNFSSLGQVLEIERFNSKDDLLSKTINTYASSDEIVQGVVSESFETYKKVDYTDIGITDDWFISSVQKTSFPSVLKSTRTIQGGSSVITNFIDHDEISGMLLETTTINSRNVKYRTKVTPAYTILEYYAMTSKNMLTQVAMTKTYMSVADQWELISAGINTWNNEWAYINENGISSVPTHSWQKIWRKHKTFIWNGTLNSDKTYQNFNELTDDNFNWDVGLAVQQSNSKWKNTGTTTLYDHYSMPLEVEDINGNKAATKMGDKQSKVYSTGNAAYNAMFYSGAEDFSATTTASAGVLKGTATINTTTAHTGIQSLSVNSGASAFKVKPQEAGTYKISVWAAKSNYTNVKLNLTGVSFKESEKVIAGDWVQLNFYATLSANQEVYVKAASGTVQVDDFRICPISSSMTSYVYNEWDELTYIIGTNNMATKYEYDAMGRLKATAVEVADFKGSGTGGFVKSSENEYTYKH